jgi:hypothetical protein
VSVNLGDSRYRTRIGLGWSMAGSLGCRSGHALRVPRQKCVDLRTFCSCIDFFCLHETETALWAEYARGRVGQHLCLKRTSHGCEALLRSVATQAALHTDNLSCQLVQVDRWVAKHGHYPAQWHSDTVAPQACSR